VFLILNLNALHIVVFDNPVSGIMQLSRMGCRNSFIPSCGSCGVGYLTAYPRFTRTVPTSVLRSVHQEIPKIRSLAGTGVSATRCITSSLANAEVATETAAPEYRRITYI
jgi:hypothetical protein